MQFQRGVAKRAFLSLITLATMTLSAEAKELGESVALIALRRYPSEVIGHLETISGRVIRMDREVARSEAPVTVHFINCTKKEALLRVVMALEMQAGVVIDAREEQWHATIRDPSKQPQPPPPSPTPREILGAIFRFFRAVWEPLFSLTLRG